MNSMVYTTVRLGDVTRITSGFAFKSELFNQRKDGLPIIRCRDVNTGLANVYYSGDYDDVYVVKNGDLLVSMDGDFRIVRWPHDNALLNQRVCRLEPNVGQLDPTYLLYYLPQQLDHIHGRTSFATVKHLSTKTICDIEIPLPYADDPARSLREQKRIAAILDKADVIRRKRQEAETTIQSLIFARYYDFFGEPISNPRAWPVKALEEVVAEGTTVSYGIVQCGDHVSDGIPYIRTSDISDERVPPLDAFGRTHPDIAKRFRRSTVRPGDLVLANRATIGAVVPVPDYLDGANLTQGTTRISPGKAVTTEYLLWTIRTPQLQAWLDRWAKGVTFREITMAKLREMPIPLPPIDLQQRFSEYLMRINRLDAHLRSASTEADAIFNSLVQRAFKGEL